MFISNDFNLTLSLLNTLLRDKYSSLEVLCEEEDVDFDYVLKLIAENNYYYNESTNQIKEK